MKPSRVSYTYLLLAAGLIFTPAFSQQPNEVEQALASLGWVNGPEEVNIADMATIDLPPRFAYLDSADTAKLMEMFQNPLSSDEYFVGPEDLRWWAVFSYDDTGHIEDGEQIDPDELLASLRTGTEISNEERRKRGWPELSIVGWQYPPFYEPETNRLAWAVIGESEGESIINYNTRLLGRTGVMSAILVASAEGLDSSVAEFKELLTGFHYNTGKRYADFVPGDKVAAYGLAALVTGGAAAAAAKSGAAKGVFKAIWIAILAAFAGIAGFVKRLFGRKSV